MGETNGVDQPSGKQKLEQMKIKKNIWLSIFRRATDRLKNDRERNDGSKALHKRKLSIHLSVLSGKGRLRQIA